MNRIYNYSTLGIVQLAKSIAAALFITTFILSALLSPVYSQEGNTIYATDTPKAIPDGPVGKADPTSVSSSLVINDSASFTDLNVYVEITHAWVGDIIITLRHVDTDTTVTMINRPGLSESQYGCGGSNIAATLDDGADDFVDSVCASAGPTIGGSLKPDNLLSEISSGDLSGTWILTVFDAVNGDSGTLESWGLIPAMGSVHAEFDYDGSEGPGNGTVNRPYITLEEALNAVADYGEIIIKGGITNETFAGVRKIKKKVTIKPFDITTTAIIGKLATP